MLNKRALRAFISSHPAPAIPSNHGLLRAPQVGYIIRTDVKIIDHRRTLVLHIYDRKQAADGNFTPVWTMFQAGKKYVTMARKPDGSARWREAAFERLGKDWRFAGSCAFYSAGDERRVRDHLSDHEPKRDGIAALILAQRAILDERTRKRQVAKERNTLRRMKPLKALPRGLKPWIRREVMPAYFRCKHTSANKPVTGVCTSCGKESTLPRAAHNGKAVCPRCKRELTVRSAGKTGKHHDRETVQVVESAGGGEVVIRIVKVYYDYDRDSLIPTEHVYENARVFVRLGPDGKAKMEPYYFAYNKGTLTHWHPGERPVFYVFGENFEAEACAHLYCRNLPDALRGTPWEYCPIDLFYAYDHQPMQMPPFLAAYIDHPALERLVKTRFNRLASDLVYGRIRDQLLDESQHRTHRILQVAAEDVDFLRDMNASAETLRTFRQYAGVKDRQRLLRWQVEREVTRDVAECLEHMTAHKLMCYVDAQYSFLRHRKTRYQTQRYHSVQSLVSEYRDYLDMCVGMGYAMNGSNLFPKDLQKAHDRVQRQVKIKNDARLRRDFDAAMKSISRNLDFEMDGMRIVLPSSPEELLAEGQQLRHCIASYADRVARRESIVLFLRLAETPDRPFFTMEIKNKRCVQVRGLCNCEPTPEVRAFVKRFEEEVLMAA